MINTLVVIVGPTGVGKTSVSYEIATRLRTEIISADSRQFYKEMKIGTAVPPDLYLSNIKHHFIRFKSVEDYYSSSLFERDVLKLLPSLFLKNRISVMTGGSGMYIDAVCRGIDDIPDIDEAIRKRYNNIFSTEGIESLRRTLKLLDPEYYSKVDLKNPKRIIRALEICEATGLPYSKFLTNTRAVRDFNIVKIGLMRDRKELYERINSRVDDMICHGLEKEAREIYNLRNFTALKTVGYSELFDFFEGKISRDEAISLIKRNSRRYAKRQITWWSRDDEIKWFSPEKVQEIIDYIGDRAQG